MKYGEGGGYEHLNNNKCDYYNRSNTPKTSTPGASGSSGSTGASGFSWSSGSSGSAGASSAPITPPIYDGKRKLNKTNAPFKGDSDEQSKLKAASDLLAPLLLNLVKDLADNKDDTPIPNRSKPKPVGLSSTLPTNTDSRADIVVDNVMGQLRTNHLAKGSIPGYKQMLLNVYKFVNSDDFIPDNKLHSLGICAYLSYDTPNSQGIATDNILNTDMLLRGQFILNGSIKNPFNNATTQKLRLGQAICQTLLQEYTKIAIGNNSQTPNSKADPFSTKLHTSNRLALAELTNTTI